MPRSDAAPGGCRCQGGREATPKPAKAERTCGPALRERGPGPWRDRRRTPRRPGGWHTAPTTAAHGGEGLADRVTPGEVPIPSQELSQPCRAQRGGQRAEVRAGEAVASTRPCSPEGGPGTGSEPAAGASRRPPSAPAWARSPGSGWRGPGRPCQSPRWLGASLAVHTPGAGGRQGAAADLPALRSRGGSVPSPQGRGCGWAGCAGCRARLSRSDPAAVPSRESAQGRDAVTLEAAALTSVYRRKN